MACDVRIAAEAAVFGQPEIKLGIIPGFGGTQRLPRLVGPNKALEMNLIGDAILAEEALDARPRQPRRPRPRAVRDGADVGGASSPPRRRSRSGRSSRSPPRAISTRASRPRSRASPPPSPARTPRRASPPSSASAPRSGAAGSPQPADGPNNATTGVENRPIGGDFGAGRADPRVACTVVLTGAGISVPSGIPDFRTPETGLWANVDPMEVAHIDVFERDPARFWSYYRPRFQSLGDKRPNAAHEALAELERRGLLEGVITQNIDRLHRAAGSRNVVEVHGSIETSSCTALRAAVYGLEEVEALFDADGIAICASCGGAGQTRRHPLRRDAARRARWPRARSCRAGRPDDLHRLLACRPPGRRPAAADPRARRPPGDRHQGGDAVRRRRGAEARRRGGRRSSARVLAALPSRSR